MFSHRRRVSLLGLTALVAASASTAYANCASPVNAIEAENCKAGSPKSVWDISGSGDPSIQGFATDISYNVGSTSTSKSIPTRRHTTSTSTGMGYYGGLGARKIATIVLGHVAAVAARLRTDTTGPGLGSRGLR